MLYTRYTMQEVGKVTHYYGKAGVAIVELTGALRAGDRIKIQSSRGEFEQAVESMEIDHQSVSEAKRGDVIGLKVAEKTPEGAAVHRL